MGRLGWVQYCQSLWWSDWRTRVAFARRAIVLLTPPSLTSIKSNRIILKIPWICVSAWNSRIRILLKKLKPWLGLPSTGATANVLKVHEIIGYRRGDWQCTGGGRGRRRQERKGGGWRLSLGHTEVDHMWQNWNCNKLSSIFYWRPAAPARVDVSDCEFIWISLHRRWTCIDEDSWPHTHKTHSSIQTLTDPV